MSHFVTVDCGLREHMKYTIADGYGRSKVGEVMLEHTRRDCVQARQLVSCDSSIFRFLIDTIKYRTPDVYRNPYGMSNQLSILTLIITVLQSSTIAREAYAASVARHHNWATRKMSSALMGSVPGRREIMGSEYGRVTVGTVNIQF